MQVKDEVFCTFHKLVKLKKYSLHGVRSGKVDVW